MVDFGIIWNFNIGVRPVDPGSSTWRSLIAGELRDIWVLPPP